MHVLQKFCEYAQVCAAVYTQLPYLLKEWFIEYILYMLIYLNTQVTYIYCASNIYLIHENATLRRLLIY